MALKDYAIKPKRVCVMARLVAVMTKEDVATLTEWIETGVPLSRMTAALRDEYPDNSVHDKSLAGHLRGKCHCTEPSQLYGVLA